ncbi:hypothetical protein HKK80_05490 [Halonotius sp. F2-221B]|uniref:hypothetical protein n=1 Tax=Halonotius sp. F2-221B TaxID=2731620 RepID=UPI00398A54B4
MNSRQYTRWGHPIDRRRPTRRRVVCCVHTAGGRFSPDAAAAPSRLVQTAGNP